jgi:hypothetical protein
LRQVPERCIRHGLVAVRDGACLLCIGVTQRRRNRRTAILYVVGCSALMIAAVPAWRWLAVPRMDSRSQKRNDARHCQLPPSSRIEFATALNGGVAPNFAHVHSAEGAEIIQRPNEEDRHLGVNQPIPRGPSQSPPLPPRARIDPQLCPVDNPADFELPKRH